MEQDDGNSQSSRFFFILSYFIFSYDSILIHPALDLPSLDTRDLEKASRGRIIVFGGRGREGIVAQKLGGNSVEKKKNAVLFCICQRPLPVFVVNPDGSVLSQRLDMR